MKEITFADYAGSNPLYAVAYRLADGLYMAGATAEAYNPSHWSSYAIPLSLANGVYAADFTGPNGQYVVGIYEQIDPTSPANPLLAEDDLIYLGDFATPQAASNAVQLLSDAKVLVANLGEQIVYKPSGGSAKPLVGIVTRKGYRTAGENSLDLIDAMTVALLTDSAEGVTSVLLKRDKISVADTYGGTPTDHVVTDIISSDAGLIELQLG